MLSRVPESVLRGIPFVYRASESPLVSQEKEPPPIDPDTVRYHQLRDLEGQIEQGRTLLASGKSVNPGQLSAQLDVLSGQRALLQNK